MDFKYQQKTDNEVQISKVNINAYPIVIDYSNIYKYNQRNITGIVETTVQEDVGVFYVEDTSIINDDVIVTSKTDDFSNPLFYQYQPKYDCIYPENIKVYDEDDKLLEFKMEYAYMGINPNYTANLLKNNTAILYDSLDSYTLYGKTSTDMTYSYFTSYSSLPFTLYGQVWNGGTITYSEELIANLDANIFSIYFNINNSASASLTAISTNNGNISILNDGGTWKVQCTVNSVMQSISILQDEWYRIDYDYTSVNTVLNIRKASDNSLQTVTFISASLFEDNHGALTVYSNNVAFFDLSFFKDSVSTNASEPLYVQRYSKSIYWSETKPASSTCQVRLLLKSNTPASIIYDSIDVNGSITQNRVEELNYKYIYKKYDNFSSADWAWDSDELRIELLDALEDATSLASNIYVKQLENKTLNVFYDTTDRKIHISEGLFYANDWDGTTNQDYYHVPEYTKMPFASDNQTDFRPYHVKIIREIANIVSSSDIQINRFSIYEGNYPDYIIPNTYEVVRYYDKNDVLQKTVVDVDDNFMTTRGINIFKNGVLIDNSEISDYNMYSGKITLRSRLNADDLIEVTYLKYMPDYIIFYPLLNQLISANAYYGGLGDNTAVRLYIRPDYPNYSFSNSQDSQSEKICYRYIVNGVATGSYISCLTNIPISALSVTNHVDTILPLADITMITDRTFTDTRERGGGIEEEHTYNYEKSSAFLDIGYGVNGKILYNSIILIKIPNSVLTDVKNNYFLNLDQFFSNDERGALAFIKQTIERYLGAGIFYVIIDENNTPWTSPFPSNIKVK